jgi:hypothetical protein
VVGRIGMPAASGFFGHVIGVLGFILMLATETLYSLRKRAIHRPLGRMRDWLQFHIFTGIVGPYLVFLHAAWSFRGLAGVVMFMTAVVVASGFIGRYIYTAVPRTADGLVVEAGVLRAQIAEAEAELVGALGDGRDSGSVRPDQPEDLKRTLRTWRRQTADPALRARAEALERTFRRRRELQRQIDSLATARRMLAVWHSVHIPLGIALFAAAFVHAGAALYYATLIR